MIDPGADMGEFPIGFENPITNPNLPWVVEYDPNNEDPTPPLERLAQEPETARVGMIRSLRSVMPGPLGIVSPGVAGINLKDYSKNPQGRGFGAPCAGQRATVRLAEAAVSVDVRVAELVGLIMRDAERRGYRHRKADTGAYNCRKIGGTNKWSNHAWALAVDVNWQSNPFTATLRTDMPVWYRHLWNRYGFAWGGDYSRKKDAMHYEFMGTPGQAATATDLARRELGGGGGAPPPPPPSGGLPAHAPGSRLLQLASPRMRGTDVKKLQETLNRYYPRETPLATDGEFGSGTDGRVKFFQSKAGLGADGKVGPATWKKLGF